MQSFLFPTMRPRERSYLSSWSANWGFLAKSGFNVGSVTLAFSLMSTSVGSCALEPSALSRVNPLPSDPECCRHRLRITISYGPPQYVRRSGDSQQWPSRSPGGGLQTAPPATPSSNPSSHAEASMASASLPRQKLPFKIFFRIGPQTETATGARLSG